MFPEIQSYELLKRDINDEDESCMKALYEGRELTEPFDPNAASSGGGAVRARPSLRISHFYACLSSSETINTKRNKDRPAKTGLCLPIPIDRLYLNL